MTAYEQGLADGLAGKTIYANPFFDEAYWKDPKAVPSIDGRRWIDGWVDGFKELARSNAIKK